MAPIDDVRSIDLRGTARGCACAADEFGDPDGPPVVLLHGGGQTRVTRGARRSRVLAERGWHAYRVDLRGHGESEWAADGDYTLDAFAGDVSRSRARSPEPPVLVGASLGGIASLAAIGEHADERRRAARSCSSTSRRKIEQDGAMRIGAFMSEHMEDGFASLDEVADAVAALQPAPAPPDRPLGAEEEPAPARRRPLVLALGPALHAAASSARATRPARRSSTRADSGRRPRTSRSRRCSCAGRVSDLLSEEGAQELLELVPARRVRRRRGRRSHGRRRQQRPLQRRHRRLPRAPLSDVASLRHMSVPESRNLGGQEPKTKFSMLCGELDGRVALEAVAGLLDVLDLRASGRRRSSSASSSSSTTDCSRMPRTSSSGTWMRDTASHRYWKLGCPLSPSAGVGSNARKRW